MIAPPCPHCGGSLTLITDTEPPPRVCNQRRNGERCKLEAGHQGPHEYEGSKK